MDKGYTDIVQIFETDSKDTANQYLSLGWVLMRHYTTCYDPHPPFCNEQYVHYVLGWVSTKGEIQKPEEEKRLFPKAR